MTTFPFELLQADSVYALAACGDTLYAGRSSGLYRSTDRGATWQNALESLGLVDSFTVTAVAAVGRTIFAGTKGTILHSDDAGQTWDIVGLASPPPTISAIALSPAYSDDGIVLAATAQDGVFVSTDRGAGWIPWNFGLIDLNVNALAVSPTFAADRRVFAATESGVFCSHNGGRAWRETAFPMTAAPVVSSAVTSSGRVYVGTEGSGLYVSGDSGQSWARVEGPLATASVTAIHAQGARVCLLLDDQWVVGSDNAWQPDAHPLPSGKTPLALLPDPAGQSVFIGFADGAVLDLH